MGYACLVDRYDSISCHPSAESGLRRFMPACGEADTRSQRIHDSLAPFPSLGHPLLPVAHYKVCAVLFYLWISLAATSLAVGLWRSLTTSDEGKGFTDAAYVVAVGGIVIYPIQNRHASRCRSGFRPTGIPTTP
jgi:hypothetical protein